VKRIRTTDNLSTIAMVDNNHIQIQAACNIVTVQNSHTQLLYLYMFVPFELINLTVYNNLTSLRSLKFKISAFPGFIECQESGTTKSVNFGYRGAEIYRVVLIILMSTSLSLIKDSKNHKTVQVTF
jgi:hypothetical protein